jgi:hypothetical protein
LRATTSAKAIDHKSLSETEHFVPVAGVVHHQTSLGVFLEVARRRVFVPIDCLSSSSAVFQAGEPAVLLVLRRFAEKEGVTLLADSHNPQSYVHERSHLKCSTFPSSKKQKEQKPKPPSGMRRIIAMCIVETTAATQSGRNSWKTELCRLLLRLFTKPAPRDV